MDIVKLLGERALANEEFTNLISIPTEEELNQIHEFIAQFADIASIDFIPTSMLPLLAESLGYEYRDTEDPEVQRELLKRLVMEYHRKGTPDQIKKAVNRGFSGNYYLGDLTYYNGDIKEGYCTLIDARDEMFRYDYSRWDWKKWPDLISCRDGILEIMASKYTDDTAKALEAVLPAGIKFIIDDICDMGDPYVDFVFFVYDGKDLWVLLDIGIIKFDVKVSIEVSRETHHYATECIVFPNNVNVEEAMTVRWIDNDTRLAGELVPWQ